MEADWPSEDHNAEYDHWLVLNAADSIVSVGQLLEQQVRTLEYLTLDMADQAPEGGSAA